MNISCSRLLLMLFFSVVVLFGVVSGCGFSVLFYCVCWFVICWCW